MKKSLVAVIALVLAGRVVTQNTQAASDYNQRLNKRLFELAARQHRVGNMYRVTIVDGVRDVDVDAFMNSHFENIQNIMFTSVVVTDKHGNPKRNKTGGIVIEGDDC